jgi:sialidase-1
MLRTIIFSSIVLAIIALATSTDAADKLNTQPKVTEIGEESVPFDFQKERGGGFRIPALFVTKMGTVLAVAERRKGYGDHDENDIVLRLSHDNGKSWGPEIDLDERGADSLNDPCIAQANNGRIFVRYTRFPEGVHTYVSDTIKMAKPGYGGPMNTRVYLVHSDDDGKTWSKPREVTRTFRRETAICIGAPGMAITLKHGPQKGRIVFPLFEVYPGKEASNKSSFTLNSACYSDDNGETWKLGKTAPPCKETGPYTNECQIVELKNGTILMSSRNEHKLDSQFRAVSRSNDGGETWSELTLEKTLPSVRCMAAMIRQGETGRLLHSHPSPDARKDGRLFASLDEGKTWQQIAQINKGYFGYSCLVTLADGTIGCIYETNGCRKMVFKRFKIEE